MNILLASSEIYPFAKTGGLADVTGALPKDIKKFGHDIRVVLPKYKNPKGECREIATIGFDLNGMNTGAAIVKSSIDGLVDAYLIEHHRYFERDSLYGYNDDGERFIFFAKAVLEMLKKINWRPDIIHCNDWQTALIPALLKTTYKDDEFFSDTNTVYTIHNLQYQGNISKDYIPMAGLKWDDLVPEKVEFWGAFSLMKCGIYYSDVFNTVSKGYAFEMQKPEYGCGLEGFIKSHAHKLYGITNGIDYDIWNPKTDKLIYVNYGPESLDTKKENKRLLQEELRLEVDDEIPLISMVTRLSDQKGLDILLPIVDKMLSKRIQFILLGTGDDHYMKAFEKVGIDHINARIMLTFDESMSHKIYAGSDLFLMPSKFEPCGLGQMICMRYGVVPVVRATGGLSDTVVDYTRDKNRGTGFSFKEYTPEKLEEAIACALDVFSDDKKEWRDLQLNGMKMDFSWKKSARKYIALYKKALQGSKVPPKAEKVAVK